MVKAIPQLLMVLAQTVVEPNCATYRQVSLYRHIVDILHQLDSQIDGTRAGASPTGGGANIEMGGPNANQLIEYVHSYDPRSWSCLHVAEGGLLCNNVVVQNNDIGPCGSDAYQQWADGISISCRSAIVRGNTVRDPTDGGIVLVRLSWYTC
jgi:hypothetical protein